MNDPLAQFRRKPAGAVAEQIPPPKGPDEYVAFDAKDKVARLRIRQATESNLSRSPGYCYLLDVVSSGENVTEIVLVYTFLMVLVSGTNLQPVLTALEMGTADFIQEYDAHKWPKPKDAKAPFIESIEVIVKESGPPLSEVEQMAKEKGRSLH